MDVELIYPGAAQGRRELGVQVVGQLGEDRVARRDAVLDDQPAVRASRVEQRVPGLDLAGDRHRADVRLAPPA